MSNADDTVVIRDIIRKLQAHVADLNVELNEEGSVGPPTLEAAEGILQNAIARLEAELESSTPDLT